ncbi:MULTISPECIES: MaoC/PaaZ C-terminal domain-containing protein [Nocardia]|uniref:Acyl dehydratase n=2 Tax=Nocardia TaxID=1817 RepID=A0A2T2ZCC4_9NOCA|nr:MULTISPECIES: MaoC/PaaZ C-terminal domain-containing protein [Nocardia]MDN2495410.1 acyl dehydratase [Nocardia nova]PSR65390.1 acyl dehydratase [Nocardia nova]
MARTPVTLTAGQELEPRRIGPITQTDIVRFAGAGGDFNPLHHDADYAVRAGLPGVIAMGQMQAGMLAAWVADLVHVEHLVSYSVRFASPLRIGEMLELGGQVESVDLEPVDPATAVATLSVHAKSGDRVVISGAAQVRISLLH